MSSIRDIRANVYLNDRTAGKTLRELESDSRKLNNELRHMPRHTKEFAEKSKQLREVRAEIKKTRQEINGMGSAWSRAASSFNKYFGLVTAGIASLTGVLLTVQTLFRGALDHSDLRADVQKTTELTDQEMEKLEQRFKRFSTRTPREELMKMASEAGKMGTRGVKDIADFVEQANMINVALGDDLGDDAILQIGKMADVYETSMIKIGSAINKTSDSTKANAGFLTEWMSRMAGTSKTVDIAGGDILGYGATLDELGMKVEMSSTALNGFFIDFVKNSEIYGKAAGFARGELTKMIGEKGANAGFLGFLEALKKANPEADTFLQKLEDVGITGDRGSQVFLALSQNIEKIRETQAMANAEMLAGTSILEEYNRKNNNLAGNWEKITNYLYDSFVNGAVVNGLSDIVSWLVKFTEVPVSETLYQERTELRMVELQLQNTNLKHEERVKLIEELKLKYPGYLGHMDADTVSNKELSLAIKSVNDQLINKIVLQEQDEKIQESNERVALVRRNVIKQEGELLERIAELSNSKKIEIESTGEVIDQAIELYNKMQRNAFGGVAFDPKAQLGKAINQYQKTVEMLNARENQNNAFLEEKNALMTRLGINIEQIDEKLQKTGDKNPFRVMADDLAKLLEGTTGAELELEFYRSDFKNFEEFQAEKLKVLQKTISGQIKMTDDEIRAREKATEEIRNFLYSLNKDEVAAAKRKFDELIALSQKFGIQRKEVEAAVQAELKRMRYEQIAGEAKEEQERLLELMENSLQQLYDYEQSLILEQRSQNLIDKEEYDRQMQELEIQHLERLIEARKAMGKETIDLEKELTAAKLDETEARIKAEADERKSQLESAAMSGWSAGEQIKHAKDKKAAILNAIREEIKAILAKAIAEQMAKVLAKVPFPFNLLAASAAGIAAGALFDSIVPSFHIGGYTGGIGLGLKDPEIPGRKIMGVVHDNEYVVAQEELRQPHFAAMIDMIEQSRLRRMGGFADGGYTNPQKTIVNNNSVNQTIDLADFKDLLTSMREWMKHPQQVVIGDRKVRELMQLQNNYREIEKNT